MAILNRRQELPRDRADLYDHASRVLLYHWDVDHKRLQLPMDAIGRREKQEMLRLIAYEMQVGEEGLKGNLIVVDRLTRILTDYLRDQGFSEPREKANQLIQQLRERNFILCYRGADTYGFVHRTFLEYFCAVEIVNRFEKVRSISFEELRDRIFGEHWQDETWHETLQLISAMIDAKFAKELINYLLIQEVDWSNFIDEYKNFKEEAFYNLLLSAICLFEIRDKSIFLSETSDIFLKLQRIVEKRDLKLNYKTASAIVIAIISIWKNQTETLPWLKILTLRRAGTIVQLAALPRLVEEWISDPEIPSILKSCAKTGRDLSVKRLAVQKLAQCFRDDPETLPWLKSRVVSDKSWAVRQEAIRELARGWKDDFEALAIIQQAAQSDCEPYVRQVAVQEVSRNLESSEVVSWLVELSKTNHDRIVKLTAWQELQRICGEKLDEL
jgi:HEAT repeats